MKFAPFGPLFDAIRAAPAPAPPRVVLAPVLPNPKRRARKAAERARRAAYVAKHSRRAGEGRHALRNARRKECLRYPLITVGLVEVDGGQDLFDLFATTQQQYSVELTANRPTTHQS